MFNNCKYCDSHAVDLVIYVKNITHTYDVETLPLHSINNQNFTSSVGVRTQMRIVAGCEFIPLCARHAKLDFTGSYFLRVPINNLPLLPEPKESLPPRSITFE